MMLSFFPVNRGLLWKEWVNYGGLITVFFLLVVYHYPLSLLLAVNRAGREENTGPFYAYVSAAINKMIMNYGIELIIFASILFAVFLASMLLGEERRNGTMGLLFSMPYSRREILINKYIFGVLSLFGIYLVNGLMYLGILASSSELQALVSVRDILSWMVIQFVIMVSIFSFALIFGSLAGSTLSGAVLSGIFLIFPIGFAILIDENLALLMGYRDFGVRNVLVGTGYWLTLPGYFAEPRVVWSYWYLFIIVSVLMFYIALRIFEHNPVERNGELLMFPRLELILKVGVAFCTMLLVGGIVFARGGLGIFGYLVGAGLGWLVSYYAIKLQRRV